MRDEARSGETDDSIYIGDMLSFRAFEFFANTRGYEWFHKHIEPEWLCWWIEILKQSDDDPLLFPHGKWATIQHLQGKVAAVAAGQRFTMQEARP